MDAERDYLTPNGISSLCLHTVPIDGEIENSAAEIIWKDRKDGKRKGGG